tara:strand:+ start:2697 stop:4355 length:1659 start_codon:yes stop_codon:yes gene_type:complete
MRRAKRLVSRRGTGARGKTKESYGCRFTLSIKKEFNMNKLLILILFFVFVCSMLGCVTVNIVRDTPKVSPPEQMKEAPIKEDTSGKYSASQKIQASKYETELQKGLDLLGRKQYGESIECFKALAIRHPEETKVQYYIALAYDESGDAREALLGYKGFVDIQTGDEVLVRKSRSRIRALKGGIADGLINAASVLAENHEYGGSLKRLEEAYDLKPSSALSRKIVELYDRHSLCSIAWKMSSLSDSLSEKSVSIVPFTNLAREETTEGSAVAMELKNELINMKKLEVYVRDDASVRAILKEIEFGSSGAIDEKSRKELGKLVSTGAIITGRIGYVADTFKINGWMINVETGKIIASKSVSVLGWNIADTDKYADFNVKVWMDRKEYRIGDPVMINVQTNKDCFVTLLNVRSNGEIWELFPNNYNQNNFIKANTRHTIPSSNDNFQLTVVAPSGQDYIKAIATSIPITREQISQVLAEDNSILVASADIVRQRGKSTFRSVSPSEMRGLHEILMRGVGTFPVQNGSHSYNNSGSIGYDTQFEFAVSTWSFVTKR